VRRVQAVIHVKEEDGDDDGFEDEEDEEEAPTSLRLVKRRGSGMMIQDDDDERSASGSEAEEEDPLGQGREEESGDELMMVCMPAVLSDELTRYLGTVEPAPKGLRRHPPCAGAAHPAAHNSAQASRHQYPATAD
jgi:hypothetical protein